MLISYYAHKKSSPRLPSWQPSLIFFNIPIESGTIIKPCTLKHFQATYMLHKTGYWTKVGSCVSFTHRFASYPTNIMEVHSSENQCHVRSPWTHDVIKTSLLRQNDVILTVITSKWCRFDVITTPLLLGCWLGGAPLSTYPDIILILMHIFYSRGGAS